jgi:prepilin-type N-terminal cleavage/methylation domain-containing protein
MRIPPTRSLSFFQTPRSASSLQPRKTRRESRAFTLIELLVVISIIAILAGLLLTSMGSTQRSGDDAKCVSNLRQVAMAVNAYANDNDDDLPGPLYAGQFPFYAGGSLSYFLVPYLGLSKTARQWAPENSVFVCPSFARAAEATPGFQDVTTYGWIPNYIAADYGTTGIRPWGYPAGSGAPERPRLKRASLGSLVAPNAPNQRPENAATAVAYREVSRVIEYRSGMMPDWFYQLPDRALHGSHINAIFWDWHVGRANATTGKALP